MEDYVEGVDYIERGWMALPGGGRLRCLTDLLTSSDCMVDEAKGETIQEKVLACRERFRAVARARMVSSP